MKKRPKHTSLSFARTLSRPYALAFVAAVANNDDNAAIEAAQKMASLEVDLPDPKVTPLGLAAANGRNSLVQRLIALGANPNGLNAQGFSALHTAAANGHFQTVQILCEAGADPDAPCGKERTTPLIAALLARAYVPATMLLQLGADVNRKDNLGNTALHCAAQMLDPEAVRIVLTKSPNLDAQDEGGFVPLVSALRTSFQDRDEKMQPGLKDEDSFERARCEVIGKILDAGFDVNDKAKYGAISPFFCALNLKRTEAANLLLDRGADPRLFWEGLPAVLFLAIQRDLDEPRLALLRRIVRASGNLDALRLENGLPILHALVELNASPEAVRVVMEEGISLATEDSEGIRPFHKALGFGNLALAKLFLEFGADPNGRDSQGRPPIFAAINGSAECLKFLLDVGATTDCWEDKSQDIIGYAKKTWEEAASQSPELLLRYTERQKILALLGADPAMRPEPLKRKFASSK